VTDLVVLSLEAWDNVWRRNQYLLDGLLRADPGLRVLFVEPAADPVHAVRRRALPRPGRGLRPAAAGSGYDDRLFLYQPTKWLPRRIDPACDSRWAHGVVRAIRRLGLRSPRLWINDPLGAELLDRLRVPALYDVTDDWTVAERAPAELARTIAQEQRLLAECREVVVCSPHLARAKGADRDVTLVTNGVDFAAYRGDAPRPEALTAGRVALYVGTLHRDRLDVDLCVATARALEGHGRLVLAGPLALSASDAARLTSAGVGLPGPQDRSVVPALLKHADVLVVPHVVTAFTESLDPIKLYEYAAAGRPVVSTPVAGFRDDTSGRVRVAQGSEFVAEVVRAVQRDRVPSVHRCGDSEFDWRLRVDQMTDVLARLETP
jgi:glycosyltransferase involved in cell wall biosynthesis